MVYFPVPWLLLAAAVATKAISLRCPDLALRDCLEPVGQMVANDLVSGYLPVMASLLHSKESTSCLLVAEAVVAKVTVSVLRRLSARSRLAWTTR